MKKFPFNITHITSRRFVDVICIFISAFLFYLSSPNYFVSQGCPIFAWVFAVSLLTWFVIKMVVGIRVSEEEEYGGLDIGECGLEAYPEFTAS